MTVTTSKLSIFSIDDISVLVKTNNQSIDKQPCLWLVHGSGGISSNEDLWSEYALKRGYTIIIVDSFSNRKIYKQYWTGAWDSLEFTKELRIPPEQRAKDQIIAYNTLKNEKQIIPFADLNNNITVGFSDGGTAAIWLQQTYSPDIWKNSYCLYPGLPPNTLSSDIYNIRKNQVHIFVGELDNWTPASHVYQYQEKTKCKFTVWPNTHHSFSKPGVMNWYKEIVNCKEELGVYCEYNAESTRKTMDIVFNE